MESSTDNIIKLAWSDKVSFEKIKRLHVINESEVIKIMRRNQKPKSFKIWRERVSGTTRKHEKKRFLSSKHFQIADYV